MEKQTRSPKKMRKISKEQNVCLLKGHFPRDDRCLVRRLGEKENATMKTRTSSETAKTK